jgi:Cap4 dsDNA endonuclease
VIDDIGNLTPPDDTGTDTFQRYRYQAQVAFPFVLECGLRGEILSVVLEHIEDLVVEYPDHWRFIQVKTRDAERGPWRLSALTDEGGALRALYRAYESLKELPVATTHEMYLEGPTHRTDPIQQLTSPAGRAGEAVQAAITKALGIEPGECARFLQRVRLKANLPARAVVHATNLRALSSQAPHVAAGTLSEIYRAVLAYLDDAMAADRLDVPWHSIVFDADRAHVAARELFEAKRLTRETIVPLLGPVTGAVRPLLRRLADVTSPPPTILEQKLLST